ncbi:hypothetical protein [Aliamphritea spongicola]|nr:hypothetical protein [Aliamphritea spongicola]
MKNSRGDIVQVTDGIGYTTSYEYNGFGDLTKTTSGTSTVTDIQLDILGRKISLDDPDKGYWTYEYNPLNLLVKQTSANGDITTFDYDLLDRMTQRTEVDLTSNWYFDTKKAGGSCPKGIGQLCEEETDTGFSRTHTYDSLARPSGMTTSMGFFNFTASMTYDSNGRVNQVTYPSGDVIKTITPPGATMKKSLTAAAR